MVEAAAPVFGITPGVAGVAGWKGRGGDGAMGRAGDGSQAGTTGPPGIIARTGATGRIGIMAAGIIASPGTTAAGITTDNQMNTPDPYLYDIPVARLGAYSGQRLIVRASEPASLPALLANQDPEGVVGVRLLALDADSEALNPWGPGLPLELAMTDPATQFPLLYQHVNLLDNHPVRVAIPVRPGFGKAVKVAVALDFAVRLDVGQPEPVLVEEMIDVMEFYLRQQTSRNRLSFFTVVLLGFYH